MKSTPSYWGSTACVSRLHDFVLARYATAAQTLLSFHRINPSAPQMRYESTSEYPCYPSHLSSVHVAWVRQSFYPSSQFFLAVSVLGFIRLADSVQFCW